MEEKANCGPEFCIKHIHSGFPSTASPACSCWPAVCSNPFWLQGGERIWRSGPGLIRQQPPSCSIFLSSHTSFHMSIHPLIWPTGCPKPTPAPTYSCLCPQQRMVCVFVHLRLPQFRALSTAKHWPWFCLGARVFSGWNGFGNHFKITQNKTCMGWRVVRQSNLTSQCLAKMSSSQSFMTKCPCCKIKVDFFFFHL